MVDYSANLFSKYSFGFVFYSAVLIVLLGSLTGSAYNPEIFNNKRLVFIFVVAISSIALLLTQFLNQKRDFSAVFLRFEVTAVLALCALGVSACFLADDVMRALNDFCLMTGFVVIAWFIASQFRDGEASKLIDVCVVLSCFYGALFLLDIALKISTWDFGFSLMNPVVGFFHPRFCNQVFASIAPLVVYAFLFQASRFKFLPLLALFFIFIILFVTEGRGFALFFTLTSIVMIGLSLENRAKKLFLFIVIGLLAFFCTQLIGYLIQLQDPEASQFAHLTKLSTSGRLNRLWPLAIDQFFQNFWWGIGPRHSYLAIGIEAHPHNFTLQLLMEYGAIFCSVLAASIGLILFRMRAFIKEIVIRRSVGLAYLGSILCAALYSQVSGVYNMPASQLVAALMIGVFLSEYRRYLSLSPEGLVGTDVGKRFSEAGLKFTSAKLAKYTLIILALTGVALSLKEYASRDLVEDPQRVYAPRVWNHDF